MFPEGRFFELLIVGALALIVVGPKDLPMLMRKVGQFVGKMRGMANEFRASFDELARQSELEELRREVEAMRHGQPAMGLPPVPSPVPPAEMRPLADDHRPPAPPAVASVVDEAGEPFEDQPGLFDDHDSAPHPGSAAPPHAAKAAGEPS